MTIKGQIFLTTSSSQFSTKFFYPNSTLFISKSSSWEEINWFGEEYENSN